MTMLMTILMTVLISRRADQTLVKIAYNVNDNINEKW
jgi:hypothetical protein